MKGVIWILSYSPSRYENKTLVDSLKISDPEATFSFWSAYVLPSFQTKSSAVVLLSTPVHQKVRMIDVSLDKNFFENKMFDM